MFEADKEALVRRLQERIEYLEEIDRWHSQSLELLSSMIGLHGRESGDSDTSTIFLTARRCISRLKLFESMGFMLVDENDSSFKLVDCQPIMDSDRLRAEVDHAIQNNTFAWALNQNKHVLIPARESGFHVILHVLATRTRIRGMFVGVLGASQKELLNAAANSMSILTVMLNNTAYAIESAALYNLVRLQNRDLEEKVKQRTMELAYQAGHDRLTGLVNRVLFIDRLEETMQRVQREGQKAAVILFDLDQFKRINDTLGHTAGDALLKKVGNRLVRGITNPEYIIARLGGDEFGLLVPGFDDECQSAKIANRIFDVMKRAFELEDTEVFSTVSVGIAHYPGDGEDAEELLKNAGIAMYQAKKTSGLSYQFYSANIDSQALEHIVLDSQLRHAIEEEQFLLHYQPQVDLKSGRIIGFEALIRWDHPDLGMVSPLDFIPLAEKSGLIIPIGEWVLETACEQLAKLRDAGFEDIHISVNLSALQFHQQKISDLIKRVLIRYGVRPGQLEVELTESVLMEDMHQGINILGQLRELGVGLAIDDFGTGYSSLNYLKSFPLDKLKIDQSFIRDLLTDSHNLAIVSAVITLAHSLGLLVVAEGVETEEQLRLLAERDCDIIQGFYFSAGLPGTDVQGLLERGVFV